MTYVISTVAVLVFPLGSLKVSVTVLAEPEIMLDGMLDEKAESPSGIVITRLGTAVTSELEIDILRPGAPAIPFNTTVIGIGWPPATTEVFTVADSIVGGQFPDACSSQHFRALGRDVERYCKVARRARARRHGTYLARRDGENYLGSAVGESQI